MREITNVNPARGGEMLLQSSLSIVVALSGASLLAAISIGKLAAALGAT